jgi:uncharacterized membrane protein YwaF
MFFAKPGEYEACGMFSTGHFVLLGISFLIICIATYFTRNLKKENVLKIIRISTVFLWVLEIIKIVFNLSIGNANKPNTYIPLYYCSLILYAGIFSGFCKGKLKQVGDVFIATGAIVGGLVFLVYPSTSIVTYPLFHYISLQSFILHTIMVYLGILVNVTGYVKLQYKDIIYYAGLIIIIGIVAYIFNLFFDSNLMFVSKNFPGTPIELVYNGTGAFFPVVIILVQAILPFYIIYLIRLFVSFVGKQRCNMKA